MFSAKNGDSWGKRGFMYWMRIRYASLRYWLAFFSILLGIVLLGMVVNDHREVHCSSAQSQPLVVIRPNFLAPREFRSLKSHLSSHSLITDNQLNQENFANTRGWIAKFSNEGIERWRSIPEMYDIVPYFDRVRNPQSNAFVMNLLIVEEPAAGHKAAVGVHQDDTVAIRHKDSFVAHQVNVLYIQVPKEMEGGQLEVWPSQHEYSEREKAVVFVEENLMAEFKGTAFHKVHGFNSPSRDTRISLVLEQYRIPDEYYDQAVDFCLNEECIKMEINNG